LNKYVIDAWAWIEYFIGSQYGAKLNEILEDASTEVYTCAITVAEVISKTVREGRDVEAAYDMLLSNSQVINADEEVSKQAGLLHAEMRKTKKDFGLADAYVLATAKELKAKILTGDAHFQNLNDIFLIK
jgi:predicted nucleic acid-binding protein